MPTKVRRNSTIHEKFKTLLCIVFKLGFLREKKHHKKQYDNLNVFQNKITKIKLKPYNYAF